MPEMTEAEKQLLMAVAYLPGRHSMLLRWPKGTPADPEHLQKFGEYWFGTYLTSWEDAYPSLQERRWISEQDGAYQITPEGTEVLRELTRVSPIHLYEYNLYYPRVQKSEAHSRFCKEVYGEDLQQHGLSDTAQLNLLLEKLTLTPKEKVLDAGCGSGRITRWLAQKSGAHFLGIDLSEQGIEEAKKLEGANTEALQFAVDNMRSLSLPEASFDALVAVDTIYYVPDLDELLQQFIKVVRPGGRMGIFCHVWIWREEDNNTLGPKENIFANALEKAHLSYEWTDLSKIGKEHWRKKLQVLERMKEDFFAEKNEALYWYRYDEAFRYGNWPEAWERRYLYLVQR